MLVVDFQKSKTDFGRVEIEEKIVVCDEGVFTPDLIAAMTAIDLQHDGYETIVKEVAT